VEIREIYGFVAFFIFLPAWGSEQPILTLIHGNMCLLQEKSRNVAKHLQNILADVFAC